MNIRSIVAIFLLCGLTGAISISAAQQLPKVSVDWAKTGATSKLTPSLYVVTNPMMRPGSPIHDSVNSALKDLGADYLRYMVLGGHKKLDVAELYPPTEGKTSWDFSLMDPLLLDFFEITKGRPAILEFNAIPDWMFKSDRPVSYPEDPNHSSEGEKSPRKVTDMVDPTGRQLADYYARIASWYTKGGFKDESGKWHASNHHFEIPYWEVLNEPDAEFSDMTPQAYTLLYDNVVTAVRKVSPKTKFVGLSLGRSQPEFFEYFLSPKNHRAGVPLDMISYHFYYVPGPTDGVEQWQYSVFSKIDEFRDNARFVEQIRQRLSPSTRTAIDETAIPLLLSDLSDFDPEARKFDIPDTYWNLSAAAFAYSYMRLCDLGVDTLNMSQGIGYPGFYPGLAMFNWVSGKPNARYWVLKLLIDSFKPGDSTVATSIIKGELDPRNAIEYFNPSIAVQGYRSMAGKRKLLLINKRDRNVQIELPPEALGASVSTVDKGTAENFPRVSVLDEPVLEMAPFAVSVVNLH